VARLLPLAALAMVAALSFTTGAAVSYAVLSDQETVPATISTAASFPSTISFVKLVGTRTCASTSSAITVPAAGVAAGNTVVIRVTLRNPSSGTISATDSRGNTYTVDANVANGTSMRTTLVSAYIGTALASGDTITVSHPSSGSSAAVAGEYSGIVATGRVDVTGTATGNSATPSASVTTTAGNRLIVGLVGSANHRTWTEASGWTGLTHVQASCGGSPGNSDNHAAYRIESSAATYTYNPVRSQSDVWAEVVVAYKGS